MRVYKVANAFPEPPALPAINRGGISLYNLIDYC